MAAPSASGGITILNSCDTGLNGVAPSAPLSGSTPAAAATLGSGYATGINGTGSGSISCGSDAKGGALQGGVYSVTATDFTVANRLAFIHCTVSDRISNLSASTGLMLYCNSSSAGTEEAAFPVSGGNLSSSAFLAFLVNLNRSTDAHLYSGTFDPSDVTHIGSAANFSTTFGQYSIDSIGYVDPIKIINGEVANKGSFADVTSHISASDAILNESPTNNLHHCFFSWGVGDGSTETHFSETLKTFEFARTVDFGEPWGRAHVNDNDLGFECNASASDGTDFELCTWIGQTKFYWRLTGSPAASVNCVSCVVQGAGDIQIDDGFPFSGLIDSCGEIAANAPTISNTTISNAAAAALELGNNGDANITNLTLSSNQTAVIVRVAGNCSLDATEFNFETSNTYYIEYTGTGTLTVTSPVSIPSGKLNASGGGTITVVSPTVDLTLTSSEASTLLQIFTTDTQTLLDSTTGTTLAYTHSNETVDVVAQKAGFLPQRQTDIALSGNVSITFNLVSDPVYDSGHGLTYTTDASWASNQLTVPTFGPTVRQVYSLMIDSFISQTALRNTAFNISMNGPNSMFLIDGAEGASDANIENMTDGGVRYVSSADVITAEWAGVQSIGTVTGTGEYQQQDGSGTTDARASGAFDELIKTYGDATHGNFDYRNHLVLKYQVNGYYQSRVDVLDTYGISAIEPTLYVVAMAPSAISAATGDPAITITITKEVTPVAWNGKDFSITILDSVGVSGEDIIRELNYNLSLDATYQGLDPFNWPDMVRELGSDYETARGIVEGDGTPQFHGARVIRTGDIPHPDFTRFQADDGTYYVVPVTANISITNMPNEGAIIRLQISNETAKTASAWAATTAYALGDKVLRTTGVGTEQTAGLYFVATTAGTTGGTEPTWNTTVGGTTNDGAVVWTCYAILYQDGNPAGSSYSANYTDGEEFASGDTYKIRFAELNGATSFKTYESTGIAGSSGFSVQVSAISDSVYATNAIDGSSTAVTDKFTADYANDEIDLDANQDFASTEAFAFYCYTISESQGMHQFWGGVTAIDAANYRINTTVVDLYFDETAGFVKQTDSARIFRSDGQRPARDPTTGGNGIEINWKNPVYLQETGVSGLTAPESAQLATIATVNSKIGTPSVDIATDIAAVKSDTAATLTDTAATIPAQIAALNNFDPVVDQVIVATNNDKTGYSVSSVSDKSGYTISGTIQTLDSLDAAQDVQHTQTQADVAAVKSDTAATKAKTDQLTFTQANNVDANIQYVNDVLVNGTGAEGDEWGP